ncbi:hypothetical protein Esti_000998 [Eimeria stiedai]
MPTPPFQWFPSSDPMHFQSGESGPVVFQPPDQPLTYTEEGVPPAPFPQQPGPPQPPLFVEIPQPTYPPQLLPQAYLFMPQPPPEPLHQAPTVVWVPVGPPPSSHDYITLPSDQNYPSYDPHPIPPGDVHDLHSVYQQDPQSSTFPGPRLPPHSERYPVPPQGPDPTQEPPPPPQPAATDAGGWESEGEGGGDGEVATQLSTLSLDDHQEGQLQMLSMKLPVHAEEAGGREAIRLVQQRRWGRATPEPLESAAAAINGQQQQQQVLLAVDVRGGDAQREPQHLMRWLEGSDVCCQLQKLGLEPLLLAFDTAAAAAAAAATATQAIHHSRVSRLPEVWLLCSSTIARASLTTTRQSFSDKSSKAWIKPMVLTSSIFQFQSVK